MNLYKNTQFGLRYKHWTYSEAIAYFVKGVARELKVAPKFFHNRYVKIATKCFKKKWLKQSDKRSYFDFEICKLPDISDSMENLRNLTVVFDDVLLFPCYHNDDYNKDKVKEFDKYLGEGPYGYTDEGFDVTVKKGDIVIDAGAWIGDFSAYAVSKGAIAYGFEPVKDTFNLLCQARDLNLDKGTIYPVQKGLGSNECEMKISITEGNSGGNSIIMKRDYEGESIFITTLDNFVESNKIERVDFIKADIEGAERDMLKGAFNVLKTFAPKLAICTYHLPDDPDVLEKLILEANPNYTVVHLRHKLFAAVI